MTTPIPSEIAQALPLMLQAIGSSTNTIVRLSDEPGFQTRDCYSIARSIVELAANVCFIIAKGPDAAERIMRHARQKAYRDLQRESRIGEGVIRAEWSGRFDVSMVEGLKEDIDEFTSRAGREKGWVDFSIDDRIKIAGEALGGSVQTPLHFACFMIYRHSSEVLHGTLFSALYFFGLTEPGERATDEASLIHHCRQQHMMILVAVGLSLTAVVQAFHLRYGFQQAHEQSVALTKAMHEIPYLKNRADG